MTRRITPATRRFGKLSNRSSMACSAGAARPVPPVNQRQIGFIASFIVIAFQHRRGGTAGLTHLPRRAEIRSRRLRLPPSTAIETSDSSAGWRSDDSFADSSDGWRHESARCWCARRSEPETPHFITADMADVFEQQLVIGVQVILRGGHLLQYVRMAANRP